MNNIKIKSIEFRNLFSYGNKWESFSPEGLCYITGMNLQNNRRNFTGKSSLLRIYPFSLFGKVEGLTKSRIINWKNRKNAESYIRFDKGGIEYTIHRGIKPDILEVYENGRLLPVPPNKKDYQAQIEEEILEMDYTTFMNVVYADTNNNMSILKMTKPMKRKFLEQLFDLEYFTKLKDAANKKINAIETKIKNIETSMEQKNKHLSYVNEERKKYVTMLEEIPHSENELIEVKKKIEKNSDTYKDALKKINAIESEKNEFDLLYIKLQNLVTKIDNKIKHIERNKIKHVDNIDINEFREKEVEIKKEESEYEKELKSIFTEYNFESIDDFIEKKDSLIEIVASLKSEYNQNKKEIEKIEEKRRNKIQDAKCPVCFQVVDHDLIDNILSDEYIKLSTERDEVYDRYKNKNEYLEEIKLNIKKIKDLNTKKENIEKIEKGLQEQINTALENKETERKNKIYTHVLNKLKACRDEKLLRIENGQKEVKQKTDELEKYKKICNEFEELEKFIEQLNKDIEKEKKQREKIKDLIDENENKKISLTNEIKNDLMVTHRIKDLYDYIRTIKNLCADEKVKQYSISNKIPFLNKRVNYYLSKSGVGFYVKLDKWLDVEIKGPGIKDCVYENLSGAERISLDRALQFAFSDINNLQSPTNINLLILDEILDSSVDTIGLKNIINTVKTKQKEDNSNVLIVSHRESFEEMDDFIDNFYCIEYDGSYSKITKRGD